MDKIKSIINCLRRPIGGRPLAELARGKKSILIVTDDNTRLTPLKIIVPAVTGELRRAGIKNSSIRILIASGTHRPMKKKELIKKFGAATCKRHRIYNHRWSDDSRLLEMDSSIKGKKICLNRMVKDAGLIIGIGSIVPHATTGFSGGGKIILPGICGLHTVEDMHWKALDFEIKDILGRYDNPMRRMVDSVARKAGLKFIVNTVMDNCGRMAGIVCGDPIEAHKKGVAIAEKVFGKRVARASDIVVADARPMDIDLRQAIKAVAAAGQAVKKGGVIVLLARCPEGVSPQFPEFLKYGFKDPEGLKKKVEQGRIKGKLMAYTLIAIGRILKYKSKIILVSQGVGSDTAEKLGFLWAASLEDALIMARKLTGTRSRVLRLRRACEVLPLLN